ncbi:MAG: SPOR domain-containing protein [Gammaproteobacteria bacterium]
MDEHSFKQRIVGAIVLVALAVIFIPMLLPGHRDIGFTDNGSPIPPKPAELENLKVLELEKPQPAPAPREIVRTPIDERSPATPAGEVEAPPAEKTPPPEEVIPEPAAKQATQTDAATPKAWAVQVGSFTQRENAMRLRDQLRSKKYKAFVEQISSAGKTFYRVRVGPEVSRDKAEALQKELQSKMKLQGSTVVSHP